MLKRIEYLNEGITNLRSLKKYINNEILLIKDEENTEDEFVIQESESEYFCKDDLVNINLDGLNFVVHFLYEKGRDDKSKEVIILRTHDSIRCGKIKINDKISSFFSKLYFLYLLKEIKKNLHLKDCWMKLLRTGRNIYNWNIMWWLMTWKIKKSAN